MRVKSLFPNLMTLGNLYCGTYAIFFTLEGKPFFAAYVIFIAMLLDFLDGKYARLIGTESEFGIQLDSMADLVSFCVAPMIFFHSLFLQEAGKTGWVFGSLYVVSGALRLARYNIQAKNKDKKYFSGLPTPAAAGLIVTFSLLCLHSERNFLHVYSPLFMFCLALLMVSSIKYPSLQKLKFNKRTTLILLGILVSLSVIFSRYLHIFLFWCFIGYTLIGPLFEIRRRV